MTIVLCAIFLFPACQASRITLTTPPVDHQTLWAEKSTSREAIAESTPNKNESHTSPIVHASDQRVEDVEEPGGTSEGERTLKEPAPAESSPEPMKPLHVLEPSDEMIPVSPWGQMIRRGELPTPLTLDHVITAVLQAYPLLQIAYLERNIAAGAYLSAQGEFDLKLKADSMNMPLGYYQTYRHSLGLEQPLFGGGTVSGGYRLGRGDFEPWYKERQTNEGGEFKLGLAVPLWQNRAIDERRAQLWRTAYGRDLVEPTIQAQLLVFIRDASLSYWDWVGAGMQYRFAQQLLNLALDRDAQLREQVRRGIRPESDLIDNERLIVSRRVKLLETQRKLLTAAAKLSLFLRWDDGSPLVPPEENLPSAFPDPHPIHPEWLDRDITYAQSRRPELRALDYERQILVVDWQLAQNQFQPELNALMSASQDIGGPASASKDKTPTELEAGLVFQVPLQRRKASGKIQAIEAKLSQWAAKRRFTAEKIAVEVQAAVIALNTAYRAVSQAREAVRLNEEMERFEIIRLDQGTSDFLRVNLREQATFDARVAEVSALQQYYEAQAEYRAAVAADLPLQPSP